MKKVGVIFGGISTEHDVSIVSGTSVIKNLDKTKYEVTPIYISKEGEWYIYNVPVNKITTLKVGEKIENLVKIENVIETLKKCDVLFPVLHGVGGEDGSIQGLFELLKIPYVGCGVLASSIGMDKAYTKIIFEKAKIKQAKYEYIRKIENEYIYIDKEFNESKCSLEEICNILVDKLKFPMFVKPSNSGSSVGINKAKNIEELKEFIEYASKFDTKILIEEGIIGREVECAVLGNVDVISSCVGEIVPAEEYYSFDAKYNNAESLCIMPADIPKEISNNIRDLAIKAFKAIDGKGLSRVDFFIEKSTNNIYINEINTMPGFTEISMYPKLFEKVGYKYPKLLDELIKLAHIGDVKNVQSL